MVPIAIGLNINWVAIGDRFNLYHVTDQSITPYTSLRDINFILKPRILVISLFNLLLWFTVEQFFMINFQPSPTSYYYYSLPTLR